MYGLSPPSVSRSTGHPKNSASSSSQRMSPKKPVGREKSASRSISDAAVSSPRAADPNRRSCVTPCLLQIAASCESSNWTMLYSLRALKPGQQNTRSRALFCNFPTPDTHVRKLGTQHPYSDVCRCMALCAACGTIRAGALTLGTTEGIRQPPITDPGSSSSSRPPNSVSAGLITFARSRGSAHR